MPEAATTLPQVQVKPGRHREATLYHALAGAGAGNGRTLEQLREAALKSYETSELPVWRRSGFWTTTLQTLDLDALETYHGTGGRHRPRGTAGRDSGGRHPHAARPSARRPDRAERRVGRPRRARPRPGRARRDPVLAGASLPRSPRAGRALVLQAPDDRPEQAGGRKRGVLDRRRLSVRAEGRRRRGPVRDRLRDRAPRRGAVRAHARRRRREQRVQAARVRPRGGLRGPGAARGGVRAVPPGRRALPPRPGPGLGHGRGVRRIDALRRRRARRLLPLAAGAARRAPRAPAPRAGRHRARRRHGLPRAVLHRGARAPRRVRGRPARDRAVAAGTCTGAAPRPARAARASRG